MGESGLVVRQERHLHPAVVLICLPDPLLLLNSRGSPLGCSIQKPDMAVAKCFYLLVASIGDGQGGDTHTQSSVLQQEA